MTIGGVAYHPHIDPVAIADVVLDCRGHGAVEGARCTPTFRVADIGVGGIGRIAVLVDEIPETLGSEVEDLWSGAISSPDARLVEVVEAGCTSLRPVSEVEVDETVTGGHSGTREDVPVAIVIDHRWIFDSGDVARIVFGTD